MYTAHISINMIACMHFISYNDNLNLKIEFTRMYKSQPSVSPVSCQIKNNIDVVSVQ